ncbi:alpha-2-macroglobulin family protein [uncultured Chitinophaga sp.]|uniref:alpha-2-macroglobulin family protein n=1 Tax=uncultured Chitinophaga sp. TaxID=339340 RepID=UPI002602F41D|nr:alpha-2-macroglobulin family protein [uncultured Chitinophaga sp.]
MRLLTVLAALLFTVSYTSVMAQYNYTNEWKKVSDLDAKGLPRSAMEAVDAIYRQARKDKQESQQLKALIFRMKYSEQLTDNGRAASLTEIDKEIQSSRGAHRAILLSMKGELLQQYLRRNRYQLYNRTTLEGDTTTDLNTWGIDRLHSEISAAYSASLKDVPALQQTSLAPYDDIIEKGNARTLRPTLFDLLAHRALDYFKSGESGLSQPANLFELEDAQAFAPAAAFAAHLFTTTDSSSLQYKALLLLQELLRFHAKGGRAPLLDADLERIRYVYQVAVMENKEELYAKALEQMQQAYSQEQEVTQVMYQLAQHYYQLDQQQDTAAKGYAAQALALCKKAIEHAPGSYGAIHCRQLLQGITAASIGLQTELVNLPDKPFRTLVSYRNLDKIYLRIMRVDEAFRQELRKAQQDYRDTTNKYWRLILYRQALKQWEQTLPNPGDYREHSVEIKTDALPLGQYMIVASNMPHMSLKNSMLAVQFIHVSQISYINRVNDYVVLHRETGQPLQNVQLRIWETLRSNRTGMETTQQLISTATSDNNGRLSTAKAISNQYRNVRLEWISGKDTLFPDNFKYLYRNNEVEGREPELPQSFLFTDRAIYRPGQTVYFKGIVVKKNNGSRESAVLPNYSTTVKLMDANGEQIDTIGVTTNDYGSYNGRFKLPEGRLNGSFTLADTRAPGVTDFSVEEYKRPKFYVEFDTVKGSYSIGDTVTIHGKALAYAGNNIDGASVKYRVVREARYPYFWMFSFRPAPSVAGREITHGELQTAADGSFTIRFAAVPDKTVKPELKPIFTYRIYADVTDLNGETRSGQEKVAAAYQLLEVKVDLPIQVTAKGFDKLKITTTNLNGTFEPAEVNVQLVPLQHPGRLIRPRYWKAPDQFVLSEKEYLNYFPLDVYKQEDQPANWQRGTAVYEAKFTTTANGAVNWTSKNNPPGWYELVVSAKDRLGNTVIQKKVFNRIDEDEKSLPFPTYFSVQFEDSAYLPGQKIAPVLGTTVKDLYVLRTLERWDQQPEDNFIRLSDRRQPAALTLTEKDRGGLRLQYTAVRDNRVFEWTQTVNVPWSDKVLEVKLAAHRDKLLPGASEQWQVQIKGPKKDQVAAELLGAMYDASLDAFRKQDWSLPSIYPSFSAGPQWEQSDNFTSRQSFNRFPPQPPVKDSAITYDALNWFDWLEGNVQYKRMYAGAVRAEAARADDSREVMAMAPPAPAAMNANARLEVSVVAQDSATPTPTPEPEAPQTVTPRKNFNETAFFFPDLHTDKEGNISLTFTVPEALTRWRFLGLAHTREMAMGYTEASIVTQKPLMVQPNAPRFMREGDNMQFSAKISNLADSTLIGQARLELLDATTMQPVDGWFQNIFPVQHFTVQKGQSTLVTFPVQIPYNFNSALLYRIVAQSGAFSDGEENALPVLTNSMLVTETLPLALRGDGTRQFSFNKLLHSDTSETLRQHAVTVEFTGNPAWYAVQALPYLMEYPHQCAEQVFNRYYANALAAHMVNALPEIKTIFGKWAKTDTVALQSNLQKNEALKAVLLQQTPWVLEARNEAEQKKRIALLFDLHRMSGELSHALDQLKQMQLPSGAFPWFNGMWEDRFITQYIVAGMGRLQQLNALTPEQKSDLQQLMNNALNYLDLRLDQDYHALLKSKADMKKQQVSGIQLHYLYMRSFFKERPVAKEIQPAYDYYFSQAKTYWQQQNRYVQAMAAIALYRNNDKVTPAAILKSLKEHAIRSEEMGMYWKEQWGYWWYQAPIETQAMLIEAFDVVANDTAAVDDMKTWLLKNKQTNNWHTTKATADACYAMLLSGNNWLTANPQVSIQLGAETISSANQPAEAGTGYFKKRIDAKAVKAAMGNIQVSLQNSQGQPAWGAVYWQYFEQLDKITAAQTPLSIEKQLFIQAINEKGPVLTPITAGRQLKIGDRVKVRVVLRADKDMEYIHLRDMRAACFEPLNVISANKWQNGLSYYESTKDASTDFFFSYLPKGVHVFEYTLFVTHEGKFSNGISTAQCMYAPEFSAHSEGMNVNVVK